MANMRCTVKFFLDQITCPGTLHLPDRNPVYLTIFLFGRLQKSPHVYPSFPMCFTTKIKFHRLFTNAKTPEQVLEILEDETILIELRQYAKGVKGGRVLAEFEETTRSFLFPSPSYIPKRNHLKRDILLNRTDNFPVGKGLDPQFTFRTKTYIEEGPFIHLTPNEISINRQIPASEVSPESKGVGKTPKKKGTRRKSSSPIHNDSTNEIKADNSNTQQESKHCICDCPTLEKEPASLDYWLENLNKRRQKKNELKPFRTGKAPKQLLSKRQFTDSFKKERNFYRKGICKLCVVPLRSCVLCNAYKSVFGLSSFLTQRFKKEKRIKDKRVKRDCRDNMELVSPGKEKYTNQTYDSSKYYSLNKSGNSRVDMNMLTSDGNVKCFETKSNIPYSVSKYSGEDLVNDVDTYNNYPRSSTRASSPNKERNVKSVPPKSMTKPSKLFTPICRSNSEEDLYPTEFDSIHQRIKNLMRKNNSALQYDLSSSESIEDDNDDADSLSLSSLEDSPTFAGSPKKLPTKSFVAPLSSEVKSLNQSKNVNELTQRDKLDARLKAIYADLYQKTLNNP